jgi:hypothetical protein
MHYVAIGSGIVSIGFALNGVRWWAGAGRHLDLSSPNDPLMLLVELKEATRNGNAMNRHAAFMTGVSVIFSAVSSLASALT